MKKIKTYKAFLKPEPAFEILPPEIRICPTEIDDEDKKVAFAPAEENIEDNIKPKETELLDPKSVDYTDYVNNNTGVDNFTLKIG